MVKREVIQNHVKTLLERMLDTHELRSTTDGEWPIRYKSALYNVRVKPGDSPHVEAYAIALDGVKATKPLLETLNEINVNASHVRAFWIGDRVVVAGEAVGETLDHEELACLCDEVGALANDIGPALKARFGGDTAFPDDGEKDPEASTATPTEGSSGGYL